MARGNVKWFNATGNEGLRLHPTSRPWQGSVRPYSAAERAGLSSLNEGQSVEYEVEATAARSQLSISKSAVEHNRGRCYGAGAALAFPATGRLTALAYYTPHGWHPRSHRCSTRSYSLNEEPEMYDTQLEDLITGQHEK